MREIPADWAETTAVVLATGPSLSAEDVDRVRAARSRRPDLRVLAVNDAYRLAEFADVLYAADARWWLAHGGAPGFAGERWTQNLAAGLNREEAPRFAALVGVLNVVRSATGDLPSLDPAVLARGANSGFQAVNMAALRGSRRIILLGFDMQTGPGGRKHFFGSHPGALDMDSPYRLFLRAFERAAPIYAERGVAILNASRRSALKCFRQASLESLL